MFQTHLPTSWWPLAKAVGKLLYGFAESVSPYVFAYLAIISVAPALSWSAVFPYVVFSVFSVSAVVDIKRSREHKK